MGKADRAGDMPTLIVLLRAGIDHHNRVNTLRQVYGQIPGIGVMRQFFGQPLRALLRFSGGKGQYGGR